MALTPKQKNSGLSTTESPLCQNGIIPLNLIVEILLKNSSKNAQIWKFPLPNPLLLLGGYYPFGMVIEGRSASSGDQYRYGFNGQEEEKEISGNETHTSAEYWMYDSRLGRRWNLDPIDQISFSNYVCFFNNPIFYSDPKGDVAGGETDGNTNNSNLNHCQEFTNPFARFATRIDMTSPLRDKIGYYFSSHVSLDREIHHYHTIGANSGLYQYYSYEYVMGHVGFMENDISKIFRPDEPAAGFTLNLFQRRFENGSSFKLGLNQEHFKLSGKLYNGENEMEFKFGGGSTLMGIRAIYMGKMQRLKGAFFNAALSVGPTFSDPTTKFTNPSGPGEGTNQPEYYIPFNGKTGYQVTGFGVTLSGGASQIVKHNDLELKFFIIGKLHHNFGRKLNFADGNPLGITQAKASFTAVGLSIGMSFNLKTISNILGK